MAPRWPLWRGSTVIYNEPLLLRGQPPISGHLPVPRGWPLNRGSTHCLRFPGIIRACSKLFYKENSLNAKKRTSYTAYLRLFVWNRNYREIFVKLYRLISLNSKTKYDYNYVRIDVLNTFLTICFFLLWELVYILERKATVHFQRREKMIGHQTHLKENEDWPLLDSALIEARRAKKKFFGDRFPPYLRVWMKRSGSATDKPLCCCFCCCCCCCCFACLFVVFLRTYHAWNRQHRSQREVANSHFSSYKWIRILECLLVDR